MDHLTKESDLDSFAMDRFITSCNASANYPKNLVQHTIYEHTIVSYFQRLNEKEHRLFGDEAVAALDFWEMDDEGHGGSPASWFLLARPILTYFDTAFWHTCVRNKTELQKQLRSAFRPGGSDPRCRFMQVLCAERRRELA